MQMKLQEIFLEARLGLKKKRINLMLLSHTSAHKPSEQALPRTPASAKIITKGKTQILSTLTFKWIQVHLCKVMNSKVCFRKTGLQIKHIRLFRIIYQLLQERKIILHLRQTISSQRWMQPTLIVNLKKYPSSHLLQYHITWKTKSGNREIVSF